ncbi:conserved hypothetical protein [Trichinella spiralis]|uniref:hypothetical protein n=1 Tax=Trichinella spiralis TaxID=6334 RepID=UPI0001EFCD56|nr:conserved hypothetical protein [Trichinella spiralis]
MARLLLSLVKGLCAKFENFPDPMSSLLLVYIAKHQPEAYADANVIEALCTLIVKVPQQRSLWQAWSNLFCVICESLMIALDEKTDWPECIAKAFIQDSLGERLWVDRKECNTFVKNIITVFNTVLPAYDAIDTLVSECIQAGGMVKCLSPTYSLIVETGPSVNEFFPKHKVCPRFVRISDSFCSHTSELLREFVSRRLDSVPRNLLLTLASCCGHEEIRQMASQKLDGWLQTNKVGRIFSLQVIVSCFKIMRLLFQMNKPLAVLLLTTFINCKALLMPTDKEVLHNLIRIRFKSKYLAAIIFDFISSKEDHSRMLKNVLREIQRGVLKSEFPLLLFCKTLFNEWKAKSEQMQAHKTLFVFHFLSINIMLFLNKPEFYSTKDYGLMDQERSFNYKAVCESGLDEETFYEILSSTAAGQLPLSGLEKFEIVEAIVHRSCASPFNEFGTGSKSCGGIGSRCWERTDRKLWYFCRSDDHIQSVRSCPFSSAEYCRFASTHYDGVLFEKSNVPVTFTGFSHGHHESTTWLVDLVRRNDDPFKYLPVACSCEFFLNDCEDADKLDLASDANQLLDTSNNNTSASSASSTGSALDPSCQSLRSELKRKRICLANELKRTIHDDKGDRHMAVQALSYLIGRLKDESSRTRCFTVQAFQELLKEEGEGRDLPKTEDRDVSCEPEYFWLFSALPSLPYYRDVIENVTDALFSVNIANAHNFEAVLFIFFSYVKACLVETDLLRLHAYIAYLHQHVDEQQSTRYCMAMCNFINKRSATFLHLVPVSAEDANELFKIATFSRLLELFYNHILQSVNKTAKDVVRDYFQVLSILFFFSNVIHIHPMKIEFRKLKKEVKILFTCTSATKFPPFIKNSFLLCNYLLEKADLNSVISCLLQFGLPIDNVSKLLRKLNNLLESSQNIPHSTVQQLLAMRYIIGAYVENGSVASDQYLRLVHKYTVADEIEDEDEDEPMDVAYADNVALTTWSCEECLQALFVELKDDLDYGWISPLQEAVSELLADFSPALLLRCANWLCDTFSTWKVDAGILKNYNSLQTILIVLLCLETEEEVRMSMSSIVERLRKIPNFDGEEVIRGCRRLLGKEISEIRRRTSLPEFTDSAIEKRKLVSSFDRSLIRFNPELMSTTITDVIEYAVSSANPSQNQVVLFALLHMTKLSTVVDIVHCMLSDYFESYNPTIILDFVAASYKSLRLPCSQDLRPVRFYERPFHLEADHLLSLAKYILAEFSIHLVPLVSLGEAPAGECVEWLGGSDEVLQSEQNWRNVREELSMQSALLEMRMKLLLEACDDDRQLMPVINWLEIKRAQDNELRELCDLMIMHIYFKRTGSCPISGGGYPLSDHLSELVNWQYNHMDTVLHHLIRRSAALARQGNVKDELKVVCSMLRRHASFHPELMHVLRNNSLLGYADNMFALLNSFLSESYCAIKYLLAKEPLIRTIAERYPEVVSIQAVISFMESVVNFEREIDDDGSFTSSPSTPSSTPVNSITTALPADDSRPISQKSSPLISLVSSSENTITAKGIKQLFEEADECFQTDHEKIASSLENVSTYMLNVNEEVRKSAVALTLKLAKEYPSKYECILPTIYAALEGDNLNALKVLLESFGEISIVFPTQILSRLFGMAFSRLLVDDSLRELFVQFFMHLLLTVNHVSANASAERH